MSEKTVGILGIVAALMLALSLLVGMQGPTVSFGFAPGQYLIRNLPTGDIATITVKSKTEEIRLDRAGKEFVVTSKKSYPAATTEVNSLIRDLTKIQLAAEVSDDPSAHEGLGVTEGSEDAKVVRFLDREGKDIVGVVVGKSVDEGQGYYVRRLGDDTVYRTDGYVYVRDRGMDYVAKELVNNERDQIEKVEVKLADGTGYLIESPEKGKIELRGVPEGKRAKGTMHESVFGATSYFTFTDFASAADKSDLRFEDVHRVTLRDGAEYTFELAKTEVVAKDADGVEQKNDDGSPKMETKWWVRAKARYVGPERNTITITKTESDEELKKKEAWLQAGDAVDAFNQKHQSWVYEVGSWKGENMVKPFADLVEDKPDRPDEIGAQHILVSWQGAERSEATRTKEEARTRAEEVMTKVRAEPDKFTDLAKEYTDEPNGKETGGDLGVFKFETMTPAFSEAAFKLEVDAISDIVESPFGFHIIKRTK